ncbi:MAG: prevent-host-death protein [Rhodoferax sp.]|nr:prevent-host-death protein [Rhodoferax sp.]
MTWSIASAKQQFSEVVRLSAEEPQVIYNRSKQAAVMVAPADFEAFQQWKSARDRPPLAQQFDEIRALLAAQGEDGIELPARTTRPNPFDDERFS